MKQLTAYFSLPALLLVLGLTFTACETNYSDPDQEVTMESTDPYAEETTAGNATSYHQSSENQEVPATLNDTLGQEYTDDETSAAYSTTRTNPANTTATGSRTQKNSVRDSLRRDSLRKVQQRKGNQ